MAYRYPKNWEQYETEMPTLAEENAELLEKMAVLMYGDVGVTQESLDNDYSHWMTKNEKFKDILYDEPIVNENSVTDELINGIWFKKDSSDTMQFDFRIDENKVYYYTVVSDIAEYRTEYRVRRLKISSCTAIKES